MLDIPMDSLPYGGRRAADSIGPVSPPFFFPPTVAPLFPNTTRFPPRARRPRARRVQARTCPEFPQSRERHRRHLVGEPREKTKDAPQHRARNAPPLRSPPFKLPRILPLYRRRRGETSTPHAHEISRSYTHAHAEERRSEGRPRALTCTRTSFCRAFSNRRLTFQNRPPSCS